MSGGRNVSELADMANVLVAQGFAAAVGQTSVPREQDALIKSFRECEICGVVCGQLGTELPDPLAERCVRIADQARVREIRHGLRCASVGDLASVRETTKRVQRLRLYQLGSVQWLLSAVGQLLIKCLERLRTPKEEIRERRRVNDDQRLSRCSRITLALDGPLYGSRSRIRSASSGKVGTRAMSLIRASRNSFSDCPASAACDFNRR
jgi:hypothetical protein